MTKPLLIIDPGHGGKDPGGGSNSSFVEKDMVLKISLYQYERFKQLGVPVALTRDKDIYIDSTPRANLVKNSGAKYCISNHINAAGNLAARGVETIHSVHSDGKLAKAIYDGIAAVGMPGRRVFTRTQSDGRDYYFMHRLTGSVSTVIVEYGFASNAEDSKLLQANWQAYAESMVKSFCAIIGHKYVAPVAEDWRKTARDWAMANGISDGSRPEDPVTRQEVWAMLERYDRLDNS